jgi:hypothetical protein
MTLLRLRSEMGRSNAIRGTSSHGKSFVRRAPLDTAGDRLVTIRDRDWLAQSRLGSRSATPRSGIITTSGRYVSGATQSKSPVAVSPSISLRTSGIGGPP